MQAIYRLRNPIKNNPFEKLTAMQLYFINSIHRFDILLPDPCRVNLLSNLVTDSIENRIRHQIG